MKKESLPKTPKRKNTNPASPPRTEKTVPRPSRQLPGTDETILPPTRTSGPIGVITHYYSHLSVAVVQLVDGSLQIGDIIQIKGHTTDLIQTIESMELDHQDVDRAVIGQLFGIKVRDHVREHDQVFKISNG